MGEHVVATGGSEFSQRSRMSGDARIVHAVNTEGIPRPLHLSVSGDVRMGSAGVIPLIEGLNAYAPVHGRVDGFVPSETHPLHFEVIKVIGNKVQELRERHGISVHVHPHRACPKADERFFQAKLTFVESRATFPVIAPVNIGDGAIKVVTPAVRAAKNPFPLRPSTRRRPRC